jgi:hypothetical protein
MMLTRKSANYLQIFVVIIPFLWGCSTDTPRPSEEKKHVDNGAKVIPEKVGDNYVSESPITAESAKVNDYTFKVRKKVDEKVCMDFFNSGKKIRSDCADSGGSFAIVTSPAPGTDINGDGLPELIVQYNSGGAHCCYNYTIFSLGNKLERIDALNGEHSYFNFRDLDGDGKYEAIGRDWTFAYWSSSFADSPAPEIILRWKNGKYGLADDLMKKPPPVEKDLYKMPPSFEESEPYTVVSAIMLKLIYTGNGNLALQYCEWFWQNLDKETPKQKRLNQKNKFLTNFKNQLGKSNYWVDIEKMNRWQGTGIK